MTPKEIVLAKYPNAKAYAYQAWYVEIQTERKILGSGKHLQEAWQDAAQRLQETGK